jgi:hypothetical protein
MKKGVSYLALGIGLLTETSFALGQRRTSDRYRAPIRCSDNAPASPRPCAAIGHPDNGRTPRRHHHPVQDGPKVADH